MTPITTFIFDCFGVISSPVLGGWYKENRKDKGLPDKDILDVFRMLDLGKLSEDDIVEYFMKYKEVRRTKEELRQDIDGYLKLNDALVQTIKGLKREGFKVVLLSNANNSFFERKVYPTYPEFKSLFDEIVISSSIGMVKPDTDIYEYTLKKIDSRPEECVFIDDNKSNVETALSLGMHGFVYTDHDSFADFLRKLGISLN